VEKINYELLLKRFNQSEFNYIELANHTAISRNTVRNVMVGRTNPSQYVAASLAEALELTQDDIIAIFFPNITLKKESAHDELKC